MIRETAAPAANGHRHSVLIVDNQRLVADLLVAHLQSELDLRVAATAADHTTAADLASHHHPDVVVANVNLPDRGAFALLRSLRSMPKPPRKILVDDRVYVAHLREGLRLGASAYHTRCDSVATLTSAIRRVAAGETSFTSEVAQRVVDTPEGPRLSPAFRYTPLETLSQRELDVLLLIVQGATVKDCAEQLNLSASTVDNHKTRFMRKLNVHRTVDLVRLAIREQLVPS